MTRVKHRNLSNRNQNYLASGFLWCFMVLLSLMVASPSCKTLQAILDNMGKKVEAFKGETQNSFKNYKKIQSNR